MVPAEPAPILPWNETSCSPMTQSDCSGKLCPSTGAGAGADGDGADGAGASAADGADDSTRRAPSDEALATMPMGTKGTKGTKGTEEAPAGAAPVGAAPAGAAPSVPAVAVAAAAAAAAAVMSVSDAS